MFGFVAAFFIQSNGFKRVLCTKRIVLSGNIKRLVLRFGRRGSSNRCRSRRCNGRSDSFRGRFHCLTHGLSFGFACGFFFYSLSSNIRSWCFRRCGKGRRRSRLTNLRCWCGWSFIGYCSGLCSLSNISLASRLSSKYQSASDRCCRFSGGSGYCGCGFRCDGGCRLTRNSHAWLTCSGLISLLSCRRLGIGLDIWCFLKFGWLWGQQFFQNFGSFTLLRYKCRGFIDKRLHFLLRLAHYIFSHPCSHARAHWNSKGFYVFCSERAAQIQLLLASSFKRLRRRS